MSTFAEEALAILGERGDNKRHLRDLGDHLGRIVPFVGAGLSMPLGYPSWGKLLEQLAPNDDLRRAVQTLLGGAHYEEAAEKVARKTPPDDFAEAIRKAFAREKLDRPIGGAPQALARWVNGPVLTTNLDAVLEAVFEQEGKQFESVFRPAIQLEGASAAIQAGKRVLIKLHGDHEDENWVLTLARSTSPSPWPSTAARISVRQSSWHRAWPPRCSPNCRGSRRHSLVQENRRAGRRGTKSCDR